MIKKAELQWMTVRSSAGSLGSGWIRKILSDESYILEVSSPGLGRPLKKEKDFIRSMGKDVDVRLYRQIDKQKEFTGALSAYDENTVTLTMEDGSRWYLKNRTLP